LEFFWEKAGNTAQKSNGKHPIVAMAGAGIIDVESKNIKN